LNKGREISQAPLVFQRFPTRTMETKFAIPVVAASFAIFGLPALAFAAMATDLIRNDAMTVD